MQLLLKKSASRQDVQCSICGQTFRLYWEQVFPSERATLLAIIQGELHYHHAPERGGDQTAAAHPAGPFPLPDWSESSQLSAVSSGGSPV